MIPFAILLTVTLVFGQDISVNETLLKVKVIEYPVNCRVVDKTVVDNLKQNLTPAAQAVAVSGATSKNQTSNSIL